MNIRKNGWAEYIGCHPNVMPTLPLGSRAETVDKNTQWRHFSKSLGGGSLPFPFPPSSSSPPSPPLPSHPILALPPFPFPYPPFPLEVGPLKSS